MSYGDKKRSDPIVTVFPSSLAVFGPAKEGEVVTERTMPLPQSSYGTQKSIVVTLLNDFSRRVLIDARIVRLPTIIVRPGKPTGAASSFCSGIIREPLNGETGILPVKKNLKIVDMFVKNGLSGNLVLAKDIPAQKFGGGSRAGSINLPGSTVTVVEEMLNALGLVGGQKVLSLVKEEYDENVSRIVGPWPAVFDTTRANELGFNGDVPLEQMCSGII